jgi:hypothetical protein
VKCEISTGEYVDDALVLNECGLQERPPVDPRILFNAQSTSEFSPTFNVAANECVQLSAFSTCGGEIQIESLLFTRPNLPLNEAGSCVCDGPLVPAPQELAVMDVCGWVLNDCAQIREICVPGTYRLRAPQPLIGCTFVSFERVPRGTTPMPVGLVFGGV